MLKFLMNIILMMTLVKQQILFFLIAFISVILSIFINNNFSLNFINDNNYRFVFVQTVFSSLLVYAIINFIFLITKKTIFTILIFSFIFFLLNFINIKKEMYLSASFTPNDFLLFQETLVAAPLTLSIGVFISIIFLSCILYLAYKKEPRYKNNFPYLNIIIPLIILSLFIFMSSKENYYHYCNKLEKVTLSCKLVSAAPRTRNNWIGDHQMIISYGFISFFISKIVDTHYEHTTAQKIFKEDISNLYKPVKLDDNKNLPNIIFVMSEAHWDATQLDKSIPRNITPTINKNQVSTLLSPSFGGGTANVEFEVLTSLNTYLNHNDLAYVSKLKRPTYSLPMYLNSLGYETTAMHNNGKYFYNRNAVYRNLGQSKT